MNEPSHYGSDAPLILVPHKAALDAELATRARRLGDDECLLAPDVQLLSAFVNDRRQTASMLLGLAWPRLAGRWELQGWWEAVIAEHLSNAPAAEIASLARQAMQADRLLWQWVSDETAIEGRVNWQRFLGWRERVARRMQMENAASPQQIIPQFETLLLEMDQQKQVPDGLLPSQIKLQGFSELTLAERSLFETFERLGIKVDFTTQSRPDGAGNATMVTCPDLNSELATAVDWARRQVLAGTPTIALIVNGLDSVSARLHRLLENAFDPKGVMCFEPSEQAAFHIDSGVTLADQPIIRDALMLLDISLKGVRREIDFPLLSNWLLSRGWAGADDERAGRANLELNIRRNAQYRCSLARVAEMGLMTRRGVDIPVLLDRVNHLAKPDQNSHPVTLFCEWLAHWGWPGCNLADAPARSASARFSGLLESFSRLEFENSPSALAALRRACLEEKITIAGGALSPVQVMTPDQAYGQNFDAAWVANLTAENWPGRATRNPFLPAALEKIIPRLSDEGLRTYTRTVNEDLLCCATNVRVSHSAWEGATPVEPSWLLRGIPAESAARESVSEGELWRTCVPEAIGISLQQSHPWMRTRADATGLPLMGTIEQKGMVSVLALQSACPFAAYLVHRLGARFEEAPDPFTSAAYSGQLVHACLERLYRPSLGRAQRPSVADVPVAVNEALEDLHASVSLHPQVLVSEQERLIRLLEEWLEFEQSCWPGVPGWLEQRLDCEFEGFRFQIRQDRIDVDSEGRQFLLDYKTGDALSSAAWARERPGEPQLPLYSVLLRQRGDAALTGAAFAKVRRGRMELIGVTGEASLETSSIAGFGKGRAAISRTFASWDDCQDQWEVWLRALAGEYRAGNCEHRMYDPGALKWSGLDLLLRETQLTRWQEQEAILERT